MTYYCVGIDGNENLMRSFLQEIKMIVKFSVIDDDSYRVGSCSHLLIETNERISQGEFMSIMENRLEELDIKQINPGPVDNGKLRLFKFDKAPPCMKSCS